MARLSNRGQGSIDQSSSHVRLCQVIDDVVAQNVQGVADDCLPSMRYRNLEGMVSAFSVADQSDSQT